MPLVQKEGVIHSSWGRKKSEGFTEQVTFELGLSNVLTFLIFSVNDKLFMRLEHRLSKAKNKM